MLEERRHSLMGIAGPLGWSRAPLALWSRNRLQNGLSINFRSATRFKPSRVILKVPQLLRASTPIAAAEARIGSIGTTDRTAGTTIPIRRSSHELHRHSLAGYLHVWMVYPPFLGTRYPLLSHRRT
ncbi:hypothetical protein GWK47_014014 [Chionoecetes opilio]|uniref:Uncharacterized protein n=1 Tax=Chionoecetes opilio TaxID=41210 RepID=A0A8J4Y424_CHIOP|nr:hypothetical protein GWK47_014014 [Chionoecetes opilio]